jgi:arylsulfatase A-like enzyme
VINAVDLFPTFCALAGTKVPAGVHSDGENVSSIFVGKPASHKNTMFWEYGRNNKSFHYPAGRDHSPNLSLRKGNWKFLINADGTGAELYDLSSDRSEQNNVAEKNPQLVSEFTTQLLAWRKSLP